jgi:hypothetical protein
MKRLIRVLLAVVMGTLFLAASAWAQSPTLYILRANSSQQPAICQTYGLSVVRQLASPQAIVVTGPGSVAPDDLVAQVTADPQVTAFEVVRKATLVEANARAQQTAPMSNASSALSTPNYQSFFGNPVWASYVTQPALAQIDWGYTPAAAQQSVGSNTPGYGAIVADIDTGVDPNQPALQGALLPGYDFVHNQPVASEWTDLDQSTAAILNQSTVAILNGYQAVQLNQSTVAILNQSTVAILNGTTLPAEFGHGTMVAGLIHLVAPGAQIMPLKAFAADGSSSTSEIVDAIYYAVANGANVINMSFSMQELSSEVLMAVNYANRQGVVCVASVGNTAQTTVVYPAALGNALGVGSVSAAGTLSAFSSYGPDLITLVAPGEGLITTYPGGNWAGVSGTSFSAALVSGTVAIGLGKENQQQTNPSNYSDLDDTMNAIASVHGYDPTLAWGILDVAKMSRIRHFGNQSHPHTP